jgi:outer membrane receptor for ferrienterochelin and colicin
MVLAQTTGTIQGKVVEENGEGLPGVTVLIQSPSMIGTRTDVTRVDGSFLFRRIPPGKYSITATMLGMATQKTEVELGLGGILRPVIVLKPEATSETLTVAVTINPVLDTPSVTSHFKSEVINQLATGRDQSDIVRLAPGVSFNAGGDASISGGNSGANTWLINGADGRFDNIRSQAGDAIINDSVQETTVLTGAISAEYGQFGGGVVNTITKSGGNDFSGSYRLALVNQDWTSRTPFEVESGIERVDTVDQIHTITTGGPIIKDRIWYFLAGEMTETNVDNQFIAPSPISDTAAASYGLPTGQTAPGGSAIPNRVDEDERFEIKISGRLAEGHDLSFSWVNREVTQNNNPQSAFDLSATATRTITREQRAFTYNGNFTPAFSVELQYSDRESVFEARQIPEHLQSQIDAGADIRIVGTNLRNQRGSRPHTNSPQFLGKPDEPRSNETYRAQASYFMITDNFGTHDLTAGVQNALDERFADNRQYVNDWAFWSDFRYEGNTAIPIYSPTSSGGRYQSRLIYLPIEIGSMTTSYETDSIFVNDIWTLNDKWTFNLGLRYDENIGFRADGVKSAEDDILSPRLSVNYDLRGDGEHVFNASYSVYAQRIGDAADDGSQAGSTSFARLNYTGPQTENYLDVIQWINDTYGEGFFLDPLNHPNTLLWEEDLHSSSNLSRGMLGSPDQVFGYVDANGNVVESGLNSPNTVETRLGYQTRFGSKGFLKTDFVHRDFEDFYVDHTDTTTGLTANGNADLNVINNQGNGLYKKEYNGIQTTFQWRFSESFNLLGNYTWSQLTGNTDGGDSSGILTTTGALTVYPEYNDFPNRSPVGYLSGDQRHILNLFALFDLNTRFGDFNFSLSERFASGSPYSISWTLDLDEFGSAYGLPDPANNDFGYESPDEDSVYYLGRGTERSDDLWETNLGINWNLHLFKKLELFVEIDIINIFNADAEHFAIGFNTTVDELAPFNVYTETPVEGVHYELDPEFGRANSTGDYQRPRSYNIDFGLRF